MREAVSDILVARSQDPGGFNRLLAYSLAVHLGIGVLAVIMPADWLASQATRPNVMEVSLGGSLGAKTTGTAPISGRRVDQAVPEPKRPEPVKPAPPPKPDTMPTPAKAATPPKPQPKPVETPPAKATTAPVRPPVTGKQVQAGTARTETGATGISQGLTQGGGGGTGGAIDLNSFDPVWVAQMTEAIKSKWANEQPESGWTEILFVLDRNGKLVKLEVTASTLSTLLNLAAERAIRTAMIPPLPRDYTDATLAVRLRFNYGIK